MIFGVELIEELEKLDPHIRSAFLKILKIIEKTIGEVVKREDFLELKKEVELLTKSVKELAEAQKRTEQVVGELAEAQRQTQKEVSRLDKALQELAEAQKRTEEALKKLTEDHKKTREHLGGLSHTVAIFLKMKHINICRNFLWKTLE